MSQYGWSSAYIAAIEEHDRLTLQRRIGDARQLMSARLGKLLAGPMTNSDGEELRQLRNCRRTLDLLERVSNDIELLSPPEFLKSA